jgi:Zn-dependent protease
MVLPVLLFSVIAHEYAHGYAALKQGDQTALMLGRLTWNPVKHIDPFMTVVLPIMLYTVTHGQMMLGGAKPVPVNPRNYRNFRRGDIIVSLAGVFTNLLLALGCTVLVAVIGLVGRLLPAFDQPIGILQAMLGYGIFLNLILIVFNLIPIPPLDGSHVMKYLLPPALSLRYQQVGRYGLIVLIVLMYTGTLGYVFIPAEYGYAILSRLVDATILPAGHMWLNRLLG